MQKVIIFLVLLLPLTASAQFKISGKIIDSADKKTVPGATVFLSNASVGTASAVDGTFTLENVRGGQYELVVSMIGYKSYHVTVLVNDNIHLPDIIISANAIGLKQVTIHPDPEWERNYEFFRRKFLGVSIYAEQCKIINPEVIDIQYDKVAKSLTAHSLDYIVIENKALGYRIKYRLDEFTNDQRQDFQYYAGEAFFEKMKGKRSEERKWEKTRFKVYKGSSMHFLRTVIADSLAWQGFTVQRLILKPNPDYKGGAQPRFFETLVSNPTLQADSFMKHTDHPGLYALVYHDCLHVTYSWGGNFENELNHAPTNIIFNKPYAFFDHNGIFIDPSSITFDGEWGSSGVAEMLPVDYEPPQKK
ncbi:MAG: carboxypeptidase-like regulatory domain-containing protein [Bacteroidetes bacterium]|nr:carboxypeptidase-like regulatory domain-containing protein [Bacteroidota bacterium]